MTNRDPSGVLLEHIEDKLSLFAENMADVPSTVKRLDERLDRLESDVQAIRSAVTDTTEQVADHEQRLTKVEVR